MPAPEAPDTRALLNTVLACAVLILSLSELYRVYLGDGSGQIVSRIAFLALCPALIQHFTVREWALTGLSGLLAMGLMQRPDGGDAVLHALDRAAFFGAFIYLVTLLKEAAQRSRSVLALGVHLTRQPPGRRYYSLAIGGHVMGVLLNFGAISLLAPLIQRGARAMAAANTDGPRADQLEQQQLSALIRGFSWMIMWSPTALTQAVLFTSFPEAQTGIVIPLGIGAAIAMILIGRAVDRFEWRNLPRPVGTAPPVLPVAEARRFAMICALLIVATFSVAIAAGVSAAIALMLVAPVVMIAWIHAQNVVAATGPAMTRTLRSLHEIFVRSAREPARSAFILGTAGFVGQAAAELAPVAELAAHLNIDALPAWVFLAALPVLITIGGQLALSPIMMVVFLSAVINELPVLPTSPTMIVFALAAGWALSMTASPNASATLLISSITRIAPTTLTWRWNGHYAVICFLAFTLAFGALAG